MRDGTFVCVGGHADATGVHHRHVADLDHSGHVCVAAQDKARGANASQPRPDRIIRGENGPPTRYVIEQVIEVAADGAAVAGKHLAVRKP